MNNYIIKKTAQKFAEDIDWKKVEPIALTMNDGKSKTDYATTCYLMYSDEGIFFRFEVGDDHINCTMRGYNMPIYEEETVELFIQPTADPTHYMEFEWNGIGGVFCAEVTNDLKGTTTLRFEPENILDSKIYAIPSGWAVQGFLPKKLFAAPFEGAWRFNAYRIKRRQDKSMILLSYNNTLIDYFHQPDMFAQLTFEE